MPSIPNTGTKRKVFVTYSHLDEQAVGRFINRWADHEGVFVAKVLGVRDEDDFIDSEDPDYVMSQIRQKYVGDSSVTIVLVGECTHSRRYVDWEIKASLTQPADGLPNGLLGILLSPLQTAYLPDRFKNNLESANQYGYARYYYEPTSATQLAAWIEDAFQARTSRTNLIVNPRDMMRYNSSCLFHHITH